MPLVKRLVAGGAGSRRRAAALIISGVVSVNGQPATNLNHPVSVSDAVSVNGKPLAQAEKRTVYLLLNKPRGYLCTVSDSRGRPTVLDLVPDSLRVAGLVPVGRLDADSTGLLLLSNDGAFVERVTHPRYGVVKEYSVLVHRALTPRDEARLLEGVEIEGGLARALSVSLVDNTESHLPRPAPRGASRLAPAARGVTSRLAPAATMGAPRQAPTAPRGEARYSLELTEGKKREVRLMMRAVGRHVLQLSRVRVGGLRLGKLSSGGVRELSAQEARKASHG